MKENLLDNFFKQKLSSYSTEVPEGMWEKIEKETANKPNSIAWWKRNVLLLSFFAIVTSSVVIYKSINHSTLNNPQNKNLQISSSINSSNKNDKVELKNQTNNTSSVVALNKNGLHFNNKKEEKINADIATKLPLNTVNLDNSIQSKKTASLKNNNLHDKKKSIPATQSKVNATLNSNILGDAEISYNSKFEKAENTSFNFLKQNGNINKMLSAKNKGLQDCPSINKKGRNDVYVEAFVAPEYTLKKVVGNSTLQNYIQLKDSAEKMIGGFSAGVMIAKNITENLLLKAGIQYSQLNEKLDLRTENDRQTITIITKRTITDASGNSFTVSDTTTYVQIGYKNSTSYNYYRNIEVPILASYEWINQRYTLSANIGAIVNVASWYKGNLLNPTYQLIAVSPKENKNMYQQKVSVSLIGGLSYIKPLNPRLDFYLQPYFRFNLSQNATTNFGYQQKFSAVGLSAGIRLKINR